MSMDVYTKTYNLTSVEERLKPIVEILVNHQDDLSDGYGYYCEYFASEQAHERYDGDLVVAALEEIAREIMERIDEQHT